ncbi:MAG: MBL fold metallo-hydrolase [Acidimicrobiia bacterium]|nr:MBL fold metallo-hydrolase [Acidimicrobiia bacterium]MDH4306243.1 MBL fold metallo-hydrolase [Acidimicrobiia bacterium]MDH5293217.1 MBL fold metallo-hydrolase [Acidimicrobiia bacterium]
MVDHPQRPLIRFLGAAKTVTGSKFLIETPRARVLVDCGLFQGEKELRERNWQPFPVDPSSIDAVVISHAHLDHVGYLPALVRHGFNGSVWASESTGRLAGVIMADSGRIQEEDAERANRKGYSKHRPALPLYTERDAVAAAALFRVAAWNAPTRVADGVSIRLTRAGHILGSASILVEFDDGTAPVHLSGDLGRPHHPVLGPPDPPPSAGTVVMETTYGDTEHLEEDGTEELGRAIARTAGRGGTVVIPAFAVDRTEVVLTALKRLTDAGAIPPIPVYLDSPMARSALGFYVRAVAEHHHEIREDVAGNPSIFDPGDLTVTESVEDSKAINHVKPPLVIISASGMATGGRVLHHLKRVLPDPASTVCLVGYQAVGTRGRDLLNGREEIKIHGEKYPVRCEIASIPAFSVHADRSELLDWLASAPETPSKIIGVHGDPEALSSLSEAVSSRFGTTLITPGQGESVLL